MRKTRILVVDDELSIIKFLRATLKAKGYEVLAAMDGAEGLQTIFCPNHLPRRDKSSNERNFE